MRIYITILLTLVSIIFIAGCNQEQASRTPQGAEPSVISEKEATTPPTKTKEKAKESTKPAKPKENTKQETQKPQTFRVGETAYYDDSKLTVLSFTPNTQSNNQFMQPKQGTQYASADVEGCAKDNTKRQVSFNPFDFKLAMQDNTRLGPAFGGPDPALNHTELLAGDCVRGYVTFEVPQGQNPKEVIFAQMGANKQPTKWTI